MKDRQLKRNQLIILCVLILIVLIVIGGVYFISKNNAALQTSTPQTESGKAGDARLYPDSTLTPGDVIATATKEEICISGYSSKVRSVTTSEKRKVYEEYGLTYPQKEGAYETDHFISLELGGSNDIKNLWPEPADPKPGFHEKDKVENYLHNKLCSGQETLQQVQDEIKTDWYKVYLEMSGQQQASPNTDLFLQFQKFFTNLLH